MEFHYKFHWSHKYILNIEFLCVLQSKTIALKYLLLSPAFNIAVDGMHHFKNLFSEAMIFRGKKSDYLFNLPCYKSPV